MATRDLEIILKVRDDATAKLEGLQKTVKGMAPAFGVMAAAGGAAFAGITGLVYKSIQGYQDVEKAQRQLQHAVVDISKGTMEQVAAIESVTMALEKKSGVDADAVRIGAAQLSTFGLQSESVVKLTKTLADLTVNQSGVNATSEDYISSANIIAKALNGEFGMLQKIGVRFTEHQKELILTGDETTKVATIIEGMNQNLRETTDTITGGVDSSIARMNRALESTGDSIAKAVAPALTDLLNKLTPVLTGFAEWAEKNPQLVSGIVEWGAGISGAVAVLGGMGLVLPKVIEGVKLLVGAFSYLAAHPALIALGVAAAALITIYQKYMQTKAALDAAKGAGETANEAANNLQALIDKSSGKQKEKLETIQTQTRTSATEAERLGNLGFFGSIWEGMKTGAENAASAAAGVRASVLQPAYAGPVAPQYAFTFNGDVMDPDKLVTQVKSALNRESLLKSTSGI